MDNRDTAIDSTSECGSGHAALEVGTGVLAVVLGPSLKFGDYSSNLMFLQNLQRYSKLTPFSSNTNSQVESGTTGYVDGCHEDQRRTLKYKI